MDCFISCIPLPLWQEFSTRYYGHPLLEEHEQIHTEIQSFLEIAREIVSNELNPPALSPSLNPYLTKSTSEFLEAENLFTTMRAEIKHISSLIECLKSAILLPKPAAMIALLPTFNPPKTVKKRRRRKPVLRYIKISDIPAKPTHYEFSCEFDYKSVEKILKERYVA